MHLIKGESLFLCCGYGLRDGGQLLTRRRDSGGDGIYVDGGCARGMYDSALETGGDSGRILSGWWSNSQSCQSSDKLE
jgi:hypothetical protein